MFEKTLDGTGKPPREIQLEYFKHLRAQMPLVRVHGMSGPPGIGKSFIARTIQRTIPDTALITTNNLLVDQYTATYRDLNGLKGKDYYETEEEYRAARKRAVHMPTVFNPLSYYYFHLRNPDMVRPTTVVIDEAHKLADMLLLAVAKSYSCKRYNIPPDLSEGQFLSWLDTLLARVSPLMRKTSLTDKQSKLVYQIEGLTLLRDYLRENLETVTVSYEMRAPQPGRAEELHIVVTPIQLPHKMLRVIFGNARLILMSGTFTEYQMKELFPDEPFDFKVFEPLAPPENRPVYVQPLQPNRRKDLAAQAQRIVDLWRKHDTPNTLVHTTYAEMAGLAQELRARGVIPIVHEKDTKNEAVAAFKKRGGILLAAGMAEGVDLPGNFCRLLIIPRLLFPNRGDSTVKKRLALPDGQFWYSMNTMETTLQQLGRGVRGADDWCNAYVFDYLFPRLVRDTKKYLTKGFLRGIK